MRSGEKISLSYDDVVAIFKAQGLTDENKWLQAVANSFEKNNGGGQAQADVATSPLLELLGTVAVPKTEQFSATDRFVVNTNATAPVVKISYLGDNFCSWFLGKIEVPSGKTDLRYYTLRQVSVDGPIITELGGDAKAETTLAQTFALIKKQKNGKAGVLLKNGYANIFYVRDIGSVLRAIIVRWIGGGWCVCASSREDPNGWDDGYRVFSRNS